MTKTLLAGSVKLRDCLDTWKLVNGPASAIVASMMRFEWQVLSGTEFGTYKGVLSFASVGLGESHVVLQDAYDRWTCEVRGDQTPSTGTAGRPASHCTTQACCAPLAHVGETLGTGRAAVCFLGHDAHTEPKVAGTVFTRQKLPALSSACGLALAQMLQVPRLSGIQTSVLS